MQRLLERLFRWRLQYLLVISFALVTAITIAVGTPINYILINNYLEDAEDKRVGRDMDLARAFYDLKLRDISAAAGRIASSRSVRHNALAAAQDDGPAIQILEEAIDNEIANYPLGTQRFVIFTDSQGRSLAGRVLNGRGLRSAQNQADWSLLPIIEQVLAKGEALAATEVVPAEVLRWVGLEDQARISLLPTEKAALEPFDPREGTAGLALVGVAPITSEEGQLIGSVLVGHLFNNDFTLVDRIKEVAGVDTVTIFFGDLRVSTNVPMDEEGQRAIGTRVSQEVFDQVLVAGEEFTGPAYVVNQWYITRYEPLYNHRNEITGILYVGTLRASFERLVDSFGRQVYLIAGASILLAVLLAIPVAWSVTRPLTGLAQATQKVAQGDWSVRVPARGPEEMVMLAESFNTMVGTLQDTQEQLVQTEKLASVGQLAAGVAHEINNPLGSVLLYADILRKETPETEQQQREDLEMIIREATRCKTIVNDLLNFSRQNEVLAQETDLNALLQDMAAEARKQVLYERIEITTELDPDLPLIQADPMQLHQVFLNLMVNAAEAMPKGGRLLLRTARGQLPGTVKVDVQDTGVGIPEENMKKRVTPFFTTKAIGRGTGLGLAIIYGIVKMHRGQIDVASEVGKGTTFTISLRVQLPSEMAAPEGAFVLQ